MRPFCLLGPDGIEIIANDIFGLITALIEIRIPFGELISTLESILLKFNFSGDRATFCAELFAKASLHRFHCSLYWADHFRGVLESDDLQLVRL